MGESLFRQFRGDRIRIRRTMLGELVQQPMREYRTELGMQIRVKQDRLSVTIAMVLDEEGLLFLAGDHANTFGTNVDEQPVRDMEQNDENIFQADECDAFDSDI
nr:retrovirus-related Pol polyprotein from transposon TNT 1-94 [Tanacetum cinerariifolium]